MQAHVSESLSGLDFKGKYGLTDYENCREPLVIFGMYRPDDLDIFTFHKGELIVVWQGMDSKDLLYEWQLKLRAKMAKHYSISHWIKNSLDFYGIPNELKYISATIANLEPCRCGNSIYFYSSNLSHESASYYGEDMIEEISERTGLNVIRTYHGLHTKDELIEIYKECFINLRLTTYDGCPNTNLEIGLMGRRSIFNGDIPHSIPWGSVDDIVYNVIKEYNNRHIFDNQKIVHDDISNFLNIKFP
jgi:hypothetical protein